MLHSLLQGADPVAQRRLAELFDQSAGYPEHLLWYPSAGNDYRDLLEMHPAITQHTGIRERPLFHVHTDYHQASVVVTPGSVLHANARTRVTLKSSNRLIFRPGASIRYGPNPQYIDFKEAAPQEPTIYLLDIRVESDICGVFEQPVFYFLFENYNFLEEVILQYHLQVSHLVKVREGCGFGGNRKSISTAYGLLSALGTRYLLVDTEEHTDFLLWQQLGQRHAIIPGAYTLHKLSDRGGWSGFQVSVFEVQYAVTKPLTQGSFRQVLDVLAHRK